MTFVKPLPGMSAMIPTVTTTGLAASTVPASVCVPSASPQRPGAALRQLTGPIAAGSAGSPVGRNVPMHGLHASSDCWQRVAGFAVFCDACRQEEADQGMDRIIASFVERHRDPRTVAPIDLVVRHATEIIAQNAKAEGQLDASELFRKAFDAAQKEWIGDSLRALFQGYLRQDSSERDRLGISSVFDNSAWYDSDVDLSIQAETRDRIIDRFSFNERFAHLRDRMLPTQIINFFLRGKLGVLPTDEEVRELFECFQNMGRAWHTDMKEILHISMWSSIFAGTRPIYQIFTQEFVKGLARRIQEEAGYLPSELLIMEIAAKEGILSEALRREGISIIPTDRVPEGDGVIEMDGLDAARKADIIIGCWLPMGEDQEPGNPFDLEIAKLLSAHPDKTLILIQSVDIDRRLTGSEEFYHFIAHNLRSCVGGSYPDEIYGDFRRNDGNGFDVDIADELGEGYSRLNHLRIWRGSWTRVHVAILRTFRRFS